MVDIVDNILHSVVKNSNNYKISNIMKNISFAGESSDGGAFSSGFGSGSVSGSGRL